MEEKLERLAKVKNKSGIHARPATIIADILKKRKAKVKLTYKGESVDARSIMGILTLAAPKNAQLKIEVEGPDAKQTLNDLLTAFTNKFGEGK
ncbi:MAG: HPr family phosphocarrier protein [Simkaniaceae bacterium]|nr:HPr family phosphocarrier protein [Simkaniaceae bacterium]